MAERFVQGYEEIAHTADWALRVWAADLPGLFVEAARGMTALMEIKHEGPRLAARQLELSADDAESLLIAFLSELLFVSESEGIGFVDARLSIEAFKLKATLVFRRIRSQRKEIKAVTYHNLAICEIDNELETVIVFDV